MTGKNRNIRAFTLVELAVVLVIIGLITGGVLKFQQLIGNARVTAVIAQSRTVMNAIATFREKYGDLPGDLVRARERLAGCTEENFCYDGGTRIGPPAFLGARIYKGGDGIIGSHNYLNDQSQIDQEATQAWRHMMLADVITGVTTRDIVAWGESHPAVPGAGGFAIQYTVGYPQQGHWLRLQNAVSGNPVQPPGLNAVSPLKAAQIDRKIDDGDVTSGTVISKGQGCGGQGIGVSTGVYDETETRNNCVLFIKLF